MTGHGLPERVEALARNVAVGLPVVDIADLVDRAAEHVADGGVEIIEGAQPPFVLELALAGAQLDAPDIDGRVARVFEKSSTACTSTRP